MCGKQYQAAQLLEYETIQMGGATSSKRRLVTGLTEEQKANIYKMFDVRGRDQVESINSEMLTNVWKGKFSDGLLAVIIPYLYKTTTEIEIEDLELFYYAMAESSAQDRAEVLVGILGIGRCIPPRIFQNFVSDLIESYMLILKIIYPERFNSWKCGDLTEKSDLAVVAKHFTKDINYVDGKIEIGELERWISNCSFVEGIHLAVIKYAFNMEVDYVIPFLPLADNASTLLRIPTVLVLSFLTKAYANCSWRLLYSSSTDAHSWNIVQRKIYGQGPTLVLIQDKDGPLIGGFASQSWKEWPRFYGDNRCFLFKLRPEMRVCESTGYNQNYQYLNAGAATLPNGMGMGGQINYFGIFLSSEFGQGSVSKTCTTFKDYIPLASHCEFTFTRLEIWGIGDPDVGVEETVRTVKERDSTALALLQMLGKAGHSKNLPDNPD